MIVKYFTQEEVNNLPDGTKVMITWSGGNGPWEYIIRQTEHGVYVEDTVTKKINYGSGIVNFVGNGKIHTKVWLVPEIVEYERNV